MQSWEIQPWKWIIQTSPYFHNRAHTSSASSNKFGCFIFIKKKKSKNKTIKHKTNYRAFIPRHNHIRCFSTASLLKSNSVRIINENHFHCKLRIILHFVFLFSTNNQILKLKKKNLRNPHYKVIYLFCLQEAIIRDPESSKI